MVLAALAVGRRGEIPTPHDARGGTRSERPMVYGEYGFEVLLILALILLNGVFAMSEIALISARRTRLQQRAEQGDAGSRRALGLVAEPNRFLSTVQIGITVIGVFAGAYGGARLAVPLERRIARMSPLAPYSEEIALAVVVVAITFLSLVIGELVPKRIALNHPERIAAVVAGPMRVLSLVAAPVVKVLSVSTDAIVRVLHLRPSTEPPVTEEELAALLKVGEAAGVFEEEETEMVERVFWLGDQPVASLMTPRDRISWLDARQAPESFRDELIRHRHSHYLVCDGEIDRVVGMVRVKDLLAGLLAGAPLELEPAIRKPVFVPGRLGALRLLETFRESGIRVAVVMGERGRVEGLVTINDVLEEFAGRLAPRAEPTIVRRDDGSWLVDAALPMVELWRRLGLRERRAGERVGLSTVGGLVARELRRVPRTGDAVESLGHRFEVVDMDGHRVDKVLVSAADRRRG